MMMSIIDLGKITGDNDCTLKFLRSKQLLRNGVLCSNCNLWMNQISDNSKADGYFWRCNFCKSTKGVRQGSFFESQKLRLPVLLTILYLFANGISGSQASSMLESECHSNSVYDWYNLYRDLMSRSLLEIPVQLGGIGKIVEIDESKWGRKRKYHVGRGTAYSQWIFGLIERGTGRVVLLTVRSRKADELIPKIIRAVLPGTTIFSDEWAAYRSLPQHGFTHQTVNHSQNFEDPLTGVHTQTIEGFWGNAKHMFKSMHGSTATQLPAHLDEIVFRWNNKGIDIFELLITKMAQFYPVSLQADPAVIAGMPPVIYNSDKVHKQK